MMIARARWRGRRRRRAARGARRWPSTRWTCPLERPFVGPDAATRAGRGERLWLAAYSRSRAKHHDFCRSPIAERHQPPRFLEDRERRHVGFETVDIFFVAFDNQPSKLKLDREGPMKTKPTRKGPARDVTAKHGSKTHHIVSVDRPRRVATPPSMCTQHAIRRGLGRIRT